MDQKDCMHALLEIGKKYMPYRYLCLKCRKLLKIASGIHIQGSDKLMVEILREGRRDVTGEKIKGRIREMIAEYKQIGEESGVAFALDKRIVLTVLLEWIEGRELNIGSGYPDNWPRCPGCGQPAIDGHITCGDARCGEGERRRDR